jgi:hypothetical protein
MNKMRISEGLIIESPYTLSLPHITEVLGIEYDLLVEGRHSLVMHQRILEEQRLFESFWEWNKVKDGVKSLGNKAVNFVKDKAMEPIDAIKTFGANTEAIILAFKKMTTDPEEFKKYATAFKTSSQSWPVAISGHVNSIAAWAEKLGLETVGEGLRKLAGILDEFKRSVSSFKGWKGVLANCSFTLMCRWLDDEFEVQEKADKLVTALTDDDPKEVAMNFLQNQGEEFADQAEEAGQFDDFKKKVLDFFAGDIEQAKELIKNNEFIQNVTKWVLDKIDFVNSVKTKIEEFIQDIAKQAAAAAAGPIGWINELVSMFKKADWVTKNIATMLNMVAKSGGSVNLARTSD